jgi:hypothetical protein
MAMNEGKPPEPFLKHCDCSKGMYMVFFLRFTERRALKKIE